MGLFAKASTNVLELRKFRLKTDGSYPTDATVTANIFTSAGVPVAAAQGISLPYVAGTLGSAAIYRGEVAHTVNLAVGGYYAEVTAVRAGKQRQWTEIIRVEA